jgi:hypothetical protein
MEAETEMTIPSSGAVTFATQRRSQRILLAVPLLVTGHHPDGTAFVEHASTLIGGGQRAAPGEWCSGACVESPGDDQNFWRVNFLPLTGPLEVQRQSGSIMIPKRPARQTPPSNDQAAEQHCFFAAV